MPEKNDLKGTNRKRTDDPAAEALFRFAGKIISLFVHELNNHLATLGECSGLADDILTAKALPDREKFRAMEQLTDRLERRICLATAFVRAFDCLGQHLEKLSDAFDPKSAVEELFPFLTKVGRQKQITVRIEAGRNLPYLNGDHILFLCLVFAIFENLCAGLEPETVVTLSIVNTSSSVIVSLTHDRAQASVSARTQWAPDTLKILAKRLAADIEQAGGGKTIRIKFPACK